jgi:hypothetical protein
MTDHTDISPRHETRCARLGCPNPVPRNPRGRPRLYCAAACRTAAHRYDTHRYDTHPPLHVEVDHGSASGRSADQVWLVRLRRGPRRVTIAVGLGRPSAEHLAHHIRDLINSPSPPGGISTASYHGNT